MRARRSVAPYGHLPVATKAAFTHNNGRYRVPRRCGACRALSEKYGPSDHPAFRPPRSGQSCSRDRGGPRGRTRQTRTIAIEDFIELREIDAIYLRERY